MKLTAIFSFCIAALVSTTEGYHIYKASSVHCRSGPSTNHKVVRSYTSKDPIKLTCQTSGQNIFGNALWDRTIDGRYMSDYYLKTGSNGYVVKNCSSSGGGHSHKIPGPIKDDYPYKGHCHGVDPWRYFKCQCTSFVAWRINSRLKVKFNNHYKGPNWGNANTWDEAARRTHVPINHTPKAGCVAQSNAGHYGHVAWVAKVTRKTVTVEEYNWRRNRYGVRTVPRSTFNYIHLKV